ncbi:hypothetical protein BJY52DRAFT_1299970 [Lactarius psammicola]|nr:hypothetical protein BJY52DRAFT_1299970 [Lactarius psammicola]
MLHPGHILLLAVFVSPRGHLMSPGIALIRYANSTEETFVAEAKWQTGGGVRSGTNNMNPYSTVSARASIDSMGSKIGRPNNESVAVECNEGGGSKVEGTD